MAEEAEEEVGGQYQSSLDMCPVTQGWQVQWDEQWPEQWPAKQSGLVISSVSSFSAAAANNSFNLPKVTNLIQKKQFRLD